MDTKVDKCYDEIGPCTSQNIGIIVALIVNTNGRTYICEHLKRKIIFVFDHLCILHFNSDRNDKPGDAI